MTSSTDIEEVTRFVDDVPIDTYEKPMMSSTQQWTRMAEDEKMHDIHAILRRPTKVLDGEFNNAFIPIALKFPDIIFQNSTNVVRKLDYFTYFRANVKVKLIFNATPFMSGKYWMFFAPFDVISNRGADIGNLANNTGYPGVEIDIASNAPVEVKIPYCAPLSHYGLIDSHSNMGELYVVSINDIQSGTSPLSNGATFSIFAWFEDIELAMPTSLPTTVPPLLHREPDTGRWVAQVGQSEEHQSTSGPPISPLFNAASNLAKYVGDSFPTLGRFVRPVEWVTRAAGKGFAALGWNKPTNLDKNCPYTNIPGKGYTNADGIDISQKLAAMPDNGVTYDGGIFSTDVDEMDIRYVASKSCIFRSAIPWTINDAVGTKLHFNPVAPGMAPRGSGFQLAPTTLAFVASMFQYWRGTIRYRLAVAKTAFHTGRIRITYHPGVYSGTDPNTVEQNAYNWILDLSVSSEISIDIPYVANVPWKEVYLGNYDDGLFALEKNTPGYLTVTVLTQLRRASDSVADNCPFNMWIAGGEDISFAIPDFGRYCVGLENPLRKDEESEKVERVWEAQVWNLTSQNIEHNEQAAATTSQDFPMRKMDETMAEQLTIGEKITNLRQLIKRFGVVSHGRPYPYASRAQDGIYCFPGPIDLDNDNFLFNRLVVDPAFFGTSQRTNVPEIQTVSLPRLRNQDGSYVTAQFAVGETTPTAVPLHYISFLYRFYRGGKRYKIVCPSTNGLRASYSGWRSAASPADSPPEVTQVLMNYEVVPRRPEDPLIVQRENTVVENGVLTNPIITTFTKETTGTPFEHFIYPDINGVAEFEVPYYGQTPISLVGQETLSFSDGPLVRRSLIEIKRSRDPKGLDEPLYEFFSGGGFPLTNVPGNPTSGGIRNCFGDYVLYEAAADDFSFGYQVGAPPLLELSAVLP